MLEIIGGMAIVVAGISIIVGVIWLIGSILDRLDALEHKASHAFKVLDNHETDIADLEDATSVIREDISMLCSRKENKGAYATATRSRKGKNNV